MVAARLFRAAGACLTMCPFVVCGGDGMPGRALQKHNGQSQRVRPHPGWMGFQFSLNSLGEACVGTGNRRRDPGVCSSYRETVPRRAYPGYGNRADRGNIVRCSARSERSVLLGRNSNGCRSGPYGCAGTDGILEVPAFSGTALAALASASTSTPTGAGASLVMMGTSPCSSPVKSWSWRRSSGVRTHRWTRRRAPSFSSTGCMSLSEPRPLPSLSCSMLLGRGDDALNDFAILDVCSNRNVQSQIGAKVGWTRARSRGQRCRSRGQRRIRLEAVSAASSSSAGGLTASTGSDVDGRRELLEAFESIKGADGFLNLEGFRNLPDIRDLLEEGLLGDSELDEIWRTTPKTDASGARVDFDGFCEAFSRIDALFEEEDEQVATVASRETTPEETPAASVGMTGDSSAAESAGGESAEETQSNPEDVFVQIVGSKTGLLDFEGLLRSNEVQELRGEGLLALKEIESIWDGLPKASGAEGGSRASTRIDLESFLEFDRKLGDLFEEEDEEDEEEECEGQGGQEGREEGLAAPKAISEATTSSGLVSDAEAPTKEKEAFPSSSGVSAEGSGQRDPRAKRFMELSAAAGGDVLGLDGLRKWEEVSELLGEELLSTAELEEIWEALPKADGSGGKAIDLPGFLQFSQRLDEMFETVEDSDGDRSNEAGTASSAPAVSVAGGFPQPGADTGIEDGRGSEAARAKARVLGLAKEEMVDCGMGCGERRRAEVLQAVEELVAAEEGNMVLEDDLGEDLVTALVGSWRLLYTSSSAIEYNQGLTGLGNTLPNAKFRGLKQVLNVDGMVFDAEYEEELSIRDEAEPLVITVASDWEVKQTSSLVTGKSSVAVKVTPKQIKYGFITVRAERWKTLRAMTLLDIAYLDQDFRIMRGQTARQNIFIFSRC